MDEECLFSLAVENCHATSNSDKLLRRSSDRIDVKKKCGVSSAADDGKNTYG